MRGVFFEEDHARAVESRLLRDGFAAAPLVLPQAPRRAKREL